ncbi:MAG: hypothetical protein H0V66_13770 [Bdellovibrionales bacterium]|nr:hypothetical protein [Bdellovibrionales bacterium]
MKKFIQFTFLLAMLSPAFAQTTTVDAGIATCGVPVCSMSEQMTALKAMNSDQRGMFALNMKAKFKDTTDTKVLENILELSKELNALSVERKDEDWVIRAAVDLTNTIIFNLAKFSEVNGENLVAFYKKFGTQTSRYNLIAHWQTQLVKIEDAKVLNELVTFAEGARNHSVSVNDEEWVPRAATSLITEITIKLTHLDPIHEGLYDVTLTDASQSVGILPFDRIAVLDSSSAKNLVVNFINSKLKVIVYTYNNAEISGNTVSGLFLSTGEMANRFKFELNRKTGEVSGLIESTKHDKIEFSGKQLFSTRTVFAGKAPKEVSSKDIIGTLSGELAGVKGTLTIRSFRENVYSAIFTSSTGSIVLNFQGKFFPKNAVLSLTSGDKVKLVLSLRENENGDATWNGASFSTTTGTSTKASFNTLK